MDLISVFSVKLLPGPGLEELGNWDVVNPPKVPKMRCDAPKTWFEASKMRRDRKIEISKIGWKIRTLINMGHFQVNHMIYIYICVCVYVYVCVCVNP